MKKQLISLLLALALILSLSVTAFAAETTTEENLMTERIALLTTQKLNSLGAELSVKRTTKIMDFDGNEYALVECSPRGYFIYHIDSGICVEYNLNAQSPYINATGEVVYGGPTYYYAKNSGAYTHTILTSTLDSAAIEGMTKQCDNWNMELLSCKNSVAADYIKGKSNSLPALTRSTGTDYWVTSKTYFTNADSNFGYVSGGYCGYIAANMILKYWDYRGTIELPSYTAQTGLTKALIEIGEPDYGSSTWASDISSVMNAYCKQNSLPEEANWAVGVFNVSSEIDNKRPVILFGSLDNFDAGNHAVVVYGYNTYENSGYETYRCHFGWNSTSTNDYTDVHVCGATGSVFGSNTKYKP